jgi:hypothetical protein
MQEIEMVRMHIALASALVAASLTGGGALAAEQTKTNKADKSQVVPQRDDLKPGAAPTVQRMDDNAQRAHDRDAGTARSGSAKPAATGGAQVRDWAQIDKNKDHLVGPEEMEQWLSQSGSKS